jgi:hypothetical protein
MNIKNSKRLLKHLYKMGLDRKYVPIMFCGATGVGKTSAVDQGGDEIKDEFDFHDFQTINLRLSQKEQGDLVGLPYEVEFVPCPYCLENGHDEFHHKVLHEKRKLMQHIENAHIKELGKKIPSYGEVMDIIRHKYAHLIETKTANATPDQLPTKGHGILHLDELNRARKDVRDAAFELVLERRLGKYKLPDNWIVVSSINPPSEEYSVDTLDDATRARFCHILFCPEVDEWIKYAKEKHLSQEVVTFVREYSQFLGNDLVDFPDGQGPVNCPRTIEMMAHLIKNLPEDLVYEVAAGCIGPEAATSYMTLLKDSKRPVPAKKIINSYESVRSIVQDYSKANNNRADLLRASIDDIIHTLSKEEENLENSQMHNLYLFTKDIPKDLTVGFIKLMTKSDSPKVQDHFRRLSGYDKMRKMMQENFSSIGRDGL